MNKARLAKLQEFEGKEDWVGLEKLARSYIKADKRDGTAWKALSAALENRGLDALPAMERALKLLPDNPQAHFNMGCGLRRIGEMQRAIAYFKRAIELKPDYAAAYNNLADALQHTGQPYEALKCYWTAIKLAPHFVNIQLNMGNCYITVGEHAKAIEMYDLACRIKPDFLEGHNARLFAKDLLPSMTIETCQEERRQWNAKFAAPLPKLSSHGNDPDPYRRIRIGYVSADFREHSAARAFASIILYHDSAQFELFAYHESKHPDDDYTRTFKKHVDHWRPIAYLNDQQVANAIVADEIDILVDLSGHSGGNRLLSFARKPAPIQCTGWGYATGTGIPEMDVFFADRVTVPESESHLYAEEVRHLPCVVGAWWGEKFPDVLELPQTVRGNITFGSLNRFSKVTDETMQLWSKVLLAVPDSVMVLKSGQFLEEEHCDRVRKIFAALGIKSERLMFIGGTPWAAHMEIYNEIDICLDPFPHGGGVTTLEALMMGVPVLTLRWPTIPGRLSSSILTTLQMPDWIAESKDEYIAKAIEKSADIASLIAVRKGLRERFLTSPIGDGRVYCQAVEEHYRDLWQGWCAQKVLDNKELSGVTSAA